MDVKHPHEIESERVKKDMEEYLKRGGKIKHIPVGVLAETSEIYKKRQEANQRAARKKEREREIIRAYTETIQP